MSPKKKSVVFENQTCKIEPEELLSQHYDYQPDPDCAGSFQPELKATNNMARGDDFISSTKSITYPVQHRGGTNEFDVQRSRVRSETFVITVSVLTAGALLFELLRRVRF